MSRSLDTDYNETIAKEYKDMEMMEKEHKAGFHKTYTEHCYDCYRENCLLKTYQVVNSNYPEGINRFNPPWLD